MENQNRPFKAPFPAFPHFSLSQKSKGHTRLGLWWSLYTNWNTHRSGASSSKAGQAQEAEQPFKNEQNWNFTSTCFNIDAYIECWVQKHRTERNTKNAKSNYINTTTTPPDHLNLSGLLAARSRYLGFGVWRHINCVLGRANMSKTLLHFDDVKKDVQNKVVKRMKHWTSQPPVDSHWPLCVSLGVFTLLPYAETYAAPATWLGAQICRKRLLAPVLCVPHSYKYFAMQNNIQ